MKTRMVVIDIDSLCCLFHDYAKLIGFPEDARPVKLMFNPQERKVGLVIDAESLTGPQFMEEIKFDLRRIHSIN